MKIKQKKIILILGILLIGSNLRAPITSIGVAIPYIKSDLNLSNGLISLLTIMPLLAFAIASLFAAKSGNSFGLERTIFCALILICLGLLTRSIANIYFLLIGTLMIGIGNAYGNVLTPAVIKGRFPRRIGIMTGLYTVIMNLCGALSSFITAPLLSHWHYSIVINLIFIVSISTLIVWIFQINHDQLKVRGMEKFTTNVWKSKVAWRITIFIGSQSLIFYSFLNWLPEYLKAKQVSLNTSGTYLTILQLCLIPMTFIIPIIVERMKQQQWVVFSSGLLFFIGTILILIDTHIVILGVILVGIASGISFGVVNTFFSLKTESSMTAAKLSGMSQSLGYLIAAIGPLFFGLLHDLTHSWFNSFLLLLVTAIIMMIFCTPAGKPLTIEKELNFKDKQVHNA